MRELTDLETAILDVEDQLWRTPGAKAAAVRQLGLGDAGYYAALNKLIDDEAALAARPVLVNRLRRRRERGRPGIRLYT